MKYFVVQVLFIFASSIFALKEPRIESCSYLDAFEIDCKWRKTNQQKHFGLFYIFGSDYHRKIKKCSPTKKFREDGIMYQHCQFPALMYQKVTAFLASDCEDSGLAGNNYNCEKNSHRNITFTVNENLIKLVSPPKNFQWLPSSLRFVWEKPGRKMSQLGFYFFRNDPKYKLKYRIVKCRFRDGNGNMGVWKTWYKGEATKFTPHHLKPGCDYMVRVYASIRKGEWSNSSRIVNISVPFVLDDVSVTETTHIPQRNKTTGEKQKSTSSFLIVYLLALCFILITLVTVGIQMCWCIWPNKFKIPKPFLMVPIDDSKDSSDFKPNLYRRDSNAFAENPTPLFYSGLSNSPKICWRKNKAEAAQGQRVDVLLSTIPHPSDQRIQIFEETGNKKNHSSTEVTNLKKANSPVDDVLLHCSRDKNKNLIVGLEKRRDSINQTPHLTPISIRKKAISNQYVDETCMITRKRMNSFKETGSDDETGNDCVRLSRSSSNLDSLDYVMDTTIPTDLNSKKKMAELDLIRSKEKDDLPEYVKESQLKEENLEQKLDHFAKAEDGESQMSESVYCNCHDVRAIALAALQIAGDLTSWKCDVCQKLLPVKNKLEETNELKAKVRKTIPQAATCASSMNAFPPLPHFQPGFCPESIA